jgi:hypothetical protein
MSEFNENLKAVERLLRTAQICGEYTAGTTLYDFLGIDKAATKEQIKASIEESYKFYLSRRYVSGWKTLTKEFNSSQRAIESLLCECRPEYDNYLLDLGVKELRNRFVSLTHADRALNATEKKDIIKEGVEIGLSETQILNMIDLWMEADDVKAIEAPSPSDASSAYMSHDELLSKTYYELFGIPNDADFSEILRVYEKEYNKYVHGKDKARWDRISDGWEILKDSEKRAAYDKKLKEPKPEVEDGVPALKVICKMDGYYLYKDIKKGTQFTETIVIKNDHKGQLQGKIISDVEWLMPERGNLAHKPEQTLEIAIITDKIPANTYDAKGTITLDTNGGPPYLISFRVILDDFETAAGSFRKTYVPLAAACAGFIGSFSRSPFLFFLVSAVFAGILFYSIAEFIVKTALKNGLNILKLPSNLIQGAAAGMVVLTILSHSFGSPVARQNIEQEKLDMSSLPEKPYVPPEQLQTPPESENRQVNVDQADRYLQFSRIDGILAKSAVALSGNMTSMDSKTAGVNAFEGVGFKALEDKTQHGFECKGQDELDFRIRSHCNDWTAIKTQPNPIAMHFNFQDWDFVQKFPKGSQCDGITCPLAPTARPHANIKNTSKQPLADALKSPSANTGYVKASRSNTRLAENIAKSKKWKPKTSSFAPPSRDDL